MQLVKLNLQKFKALENFSMTFGPRINAVRGPVGSGKTTIFQALHLMKYLILGDQWFNQINPDEFGSEEEPLLQMEALFRDEDRYLSWANHWHSPGRYTAFEKIREGPTPDSMTDVLVFQNHGFEISEGDQTYKNGFQIRRLRSAAIDCVTWPGGNFYRGIRERIRGWARKVILLDVLTPRDLTERNYCTYDSFGIGGFGFPGFLAGLSPRRLRRVEDRMKGYDSTFTRLKQIVCPGHMATVEVWERGEFRKLDLLGNGQLRLLAFAAMPELPADLIILEEMESGIPTERFPQILDDLSQCTFQTLLSSYAPTEIPGGSITTLPVSTDSIEIG